MLSSLFGSKSRANVLIFLAARGYGYAREIAGFYDANLSPIQKQLDNLENNNILFSKLSGKTRLYGFNPRFPFLPELKALLERAIGFLPEDDRNRLLLIRKRPRRKGKPL